MTMLSKDQSVTELSLQISSRLCIFCTARVWVDSDPSGRVLNESNRSGVAATMIRSILAPIDDVTVPLSELSDPDVFIKAAAVFLKDCQGRILRCPLLNASFQSQSWIRQMVWSVCRLTSKRLTRKWPSL